MTLKITAVAQTFNFCLSQSRRRPRNSSSSVIGPTMTITSIATGNSIQSCGKMSGVGIGSILMPAHSSNATADVMNPTSPAPTSALITIAFLPTVAKRVRKSVHGSLCESR